MLKNMKLGTKLIIVFLLVGLVPLGTIGILSLTKSKTALSKQAFNQLIALRGVKKAQVENYFGERQGDMGVLVETVGTLRSEALNKLKAVQAIKKNQIEGYFAERLGDVDVLSTNDFVINAIMAYEAGWKAGGALSSSYRSADKKYSDWLTQYEKKYGYYDLFLISKDGDIVYTVEKEPDFGTNVATGKYSDQNIADLFKKSKNGISIVDFEPYAPSNGAPASFVGAPVYDNGSFIGVVALQIPLDQINNIMMERAGMGQTGECYLVGSDLRMRSDSYLDPEKHSVHASLNGTIEKNGVDTEAAREAIAGNADAKVVLDYNDNPVLSCYAPVSIGDLTWAVLAEIDVAEAFCPRDKDGKAFFAKYTEMYGYYDLFLVNPDGFVFYTVAQEADYNTNLINGQYSSSNLGKLTRDVLNSKQFGFADFRPYAPSNNEPCAFIAQPCIANGTVEMIVALQLPLEAINAIMQERSGMGETGETYLVGPDKLMRSDSYLDPTGHSVKASFAGTVDKNGVDTDASRGALSGNTEAEIIMDYNGNPVLSAYMPVMVFGASWAMIAEIDESEAFATVNALQMAIMLIGAVMAAIVVLVGWMIARSIAKPIANMSAVAEAISTGDINHDIEVKSKDEIGVLGESFKSLIAYMQEMARAAESIAGNNLQAEVEPKSKHDVLGIAFKKMIGNLDTMIRQLRDNAGELVSAANEISSSSEQMAQGAKSQTDQAAQVSSAIEEMTATIIQSSKNANEAKESSENAANTSAEGQTIVGETINGMVKIAQSAEESGQIINELATASDKIGEIIGVIDDIADQTNLLALNAAIEAARAGEQGRGFAVVADEVRKLAERTGKATGEITEMIKGIQSDSGRAVTSMDEAGKLVEEGKGLADKAGNSLDAINSISQQVTDMIVQIATAADQQSSAAEQISKNMEMISNVSKESAAGAEQSASAAEELNRQAEGMQKMVAQFKIKENA
ncbi:MAG: methyl-accepting chemotaxis protein [candidate division Zixibacteria bacterium]